MPPPKNKLHDPAASSSAASSRATPAAAFDDGVRGIPTNALPVSLCAPPIRKVLKGFKKLGSGGEGTVFGAQTKPGETIGGYVRVGRSLGRTGEFKGQFFSIRSCWRIP